MLRNRPLVTPEWLNAHLSHPNLFIIETSLTSPVAKSSGVDEDERLEQPAGIPGAVAISLDRQLYDRQSSLPHMLPKPHDFALEASAFGISNDSIIVVYDRVGIYSSPRARWMLKVMGHENVAVLDGGLPAWISAQYPVGELRKAEAVGPLFQTQYQAALVSSADQVADALSANDKRVIDARSAERFQGQAKEPRPGLRSGHMPNAINIPFDEVLRDGRMKPRDELKRLFGDRFDPQHALIFSCGSGVTACIVALAAELAGYRDISVYDGSWSEWGLDPRRPVTVG